ncbi:2-C-methyl-D-erythritol 2,4-cyclodiphosphate synthase [hydrothermal vent metagenome]|uniref:2-C-methyl-D-erythritol 2,4-cyclodiphosphate synthase n=1 Tax=hydrothermal vent metagenome TaxID=652676 RepID=A0A3B0V6W0_9ZZZZ
MPIDLRIGTGYDVHAFCPGSELMLAGIAIPFNKAFDAHSDGDVLIHAICDALLGALALGDIGQHFPPSDNKWKNCDSSVFLEHVMRLITAQGFHVNNIDNTIICEQPKMQPHILTMRQSLANIMGLTLNQVSIKATTTEKLGFCGREKGIAVQSTCLLTKI